jgi:glycosyltransferase 2 family protein
VKHLLAKNLHIAYHTIIRSSAMKYFIFGILFSVGSLLFAYVIHQTGVGAIWSTVSQMSALNCSLYLLLGLSIFGLYALRWKIILNCHGHKVGFIKIFLHRLAAYGVSYITPAQLGGDPVRIYLLSESENINLRDSTASVITDKLFELTALVIFITAGVVYLAFTNLVSNGTQWLLYGVMAGFIALLYYAYKKVADGTGFFRSIFKLLHLHKIKKLQHLESKIERTENRIADFLNHTYHRRTTIPMISILSLTIVSFSILEHWLLASFLGINLTFTQAFLVSTIPLVAYILPLPLGIGVFEGAHVGLFALLGYSPATALAIVLGIRTKDLIASLIGFIYASSHGVHLIGRKRNVPTKKELRVLNRTEPNREAERSTGEIGL